MARPASLRLGAYPGVGLAEARAEAATARSKLDDGIDPAAEAREAAQKAKEEASQAKAARMPTVEAFAPEFIERHSKRQKRSWR